MSFRIIKYLILLVLIIMPPGTWLYGAITGSTSSFSLNSRKFDPSNFEVIPTRADAVANDPFAGVQFQRCESNRILKGWIDDSFEGAKALTNLYGDLTDSDFFGTGGESSLCKDPLIVKTESTDCSSYVNKDGGFDVKAWKKATGALRTLEGVARCKANKAKDASKMADCFEQEIKDVKRRMETIEKDFRDFVAQANAYRTYLKNEIAKQQRNSQALGGRIQAISDTKNQIEQALAKIGDTSTPSKDGGNETGSISREKKRLDQLKVDQKIFELDKKKVRVRRSLACFQADGATDSNFRSCQDRDHKFFASPLECIFSRYKDRQINFYSGGAQNGVLIIQNDEEAKAGADQLRFQSAVARMIADLQASTRTGSSINYDALKKRLSRYGVDGLSVVNELQLCEQQVKDEIDTELASGDGELGGRAHGLKNAAESISSELGQMCDQMDTAMRDAGREVFGAELTVFFNPNGCHEKTTQTTNGQLAFSNVQLDGQLQNVQGMRSTLEAMLRGTLPPGATVPLKVPLRVPGSDGLQLTCEGLRPCLKVATDLKADVDSRISQLQTGDWPCKSAASGQCPGLSKFKEQTDQAIERAMTNVAASLERQMANLLAQQDRVIASLKEEGLSTPKNERRSKVQFHCDKSGDDICQLPPDLGDIIAGMAGAPILSADPFETVSESAKQKEEEYKRDESKIADNLKAVTAIKGKCQKEEKKTKREEQGHASSELANARKGFDEALKLCMEAANSLNQAKIAAASTGGSKELPSDVITRVQSALNSCKERVGEVEIEMDRICQAFEEKDKPVRCKHIGDAAAEVRRNCENSCPKVGQDLVEKKEKEKTPEEKEQAARQLDRKKAEDEEAIAKAKLEKAKADAERKKIEPPPKRFR